MTSRLRRAVRTGAALPGRGLRLVQRVAAQIDLANTADTLRTTQTRERWLAVGQEVTTAMLEGTDVEDALALIAARLREVAGADASCLVLPGVGGDWVIEIADGDPGDLVGTVMPPDGRAHRALASRKGIVVPSLARTASLRVPQFGRYGPALYAPLVVGATSTGVIVLLRARGAPEFSPAELAIAESFARQAALALELAAARRDQQRASLLEERARIARDLHDLAIQQLFATGLTIARARETLPPGPAADDLAAALDGLDEAVAQIRGIVASLRRADVAAPLSGRLAHELALARVGLGFAPTLALDGGADAIDSWAHGADPALVDDVVAVVREGLANAARHARAQHVQVRVGLDRAGEGAGEAVTGAVTGAVTVRVVDDGVGIDRDRTRSSGLDNLGARAARWDGRLALESGEGGDGGEGGGTALWWTAAQEP